MFTAGRVPVSQAVPPKAWGPALLSLLFLALIGAAPAATEESANLRRSARAFPEHTDIRQARSELLFAPLNELLQFRGTVEERGGGRSVSVQLRQNADAVYLLFLPETDGRFPVYGRGAYIIKRSRSDGAFLQVKIFLRNDPEFFARIFPADAGSAPSGAGPATMDIYVAGQRIYESVRLPVTFDRVLRIPFSDIVSMTRPIVRWELVLAHPPREGHRALSQVAERLRSGISREESPADSDTTGGQAMRLLELLSSLEREGVSNTFPDAVLAQFPQQPLFRSQLREVREVPFSRYIRGRGYRVAELEKVLYVLSIIEPGTAYAVALEEAGPAATTDAQGNVGRAMPSGRPESADLRPTSREHYLALPRITANGAFEVELFGSAGERDLRSVIRQRSGWTARLVGLPTIE